MHAALAAAVYRERPQQLSRAEQEWDVSQARSPAQGARGGLRSWQTAQGAWQVLWTWQGARGMAWQGLGAWRAGGVHDKG